MIRVAYEYEFREHKLPDQKVEVGQFRIPRLNISFGFETSKLHEEIGLVLPLLENICSPTEIPADLGFFPLETSFLRIFPRILVPRVIVSL